MARIKVGGMYHDSTRPEIYGEVHLVGRKIVVIQLDDGRRKYVAVKNVTQGYPVKIHTMKEPSSEIAALIKRCDTCTADEEAKVAAHIEREARLIRRTWEPTQIHIFQPAREQ